jgi:hypothetical protein
MFPLSRVAMETRFFEQQFYCAPIFSSRIIVPQLEFPTSIPMG